MQYKYDNIFYLLNDSSRLQDILVNDIETLNDVLTRERQLSKKVGCDNVLTAKRDCKERLIFTIVDGKLILLDDITDHRYNRLNAMDRKGNRAILREILGEENKLVKVNVRRGNNGAVVSLTVEDLEHENDDNLVQFVQGRFIRNNEEQNRILRSLGLSHKLVVGGPGSGKTLTIGQIARVAGRGLYIAKEPNLVKRFKEDFADHENIECMSWCDFIGINEGVQQYSYQNFYKWVDERLNAKGKIGSSLQYIVGFWKKAVGTKKKIDREIFITNLYEEMRIITGYSADEYKKLGVRQKLFWHSEKEGHNEIAEALLYLSEQYKLELNAIGGIDISLYTPGQGRVQEALYGYTKVLFDEAQDIPRGALKVFCAALDSVNLQGESYCQATICFDNQQSMTDTITALPFIQNCLGNVEVHYLSEPYRSSGDVLSWANNCLIVKNTIAGGIDGKEDYSSLLSSEAVSSSVVTVIGEDNVGEVEKLHKLLKDAGDDVVIITPNDKSSVNARRMFKEAIIYTAEEAKGLEFKTVVQYGFYKSDNSRLRTINSNYRNDVYSNGTLARSKDKNSLARNNSLYFHQLFVSATRAIEELIIVDDVAVCSSLNSLWTELSRNIQVSFEISLAKKEEGIPELSIIELIESYFDKVNELVSRRSDDISRGIYVNIDALDTMIARLETELHELIDSGVNSRISETLWGLTRLSGVLRREHLEIFIENENVSIDMLLDVANITKEVDAVGKIYRRIDRLEGEERKLDFLTKLLKIIYERRDVLDSEEIRALFLNVKIHANSLFCKLISKVEALQIVITFAESAFVKKDIFSSLSECETNLESIGVILSRPNINLCVVLSLIKNKNFSLKFILDKISFWGAIENNEISQAINRRKQDGSIASEEVGSEVCSTGKQVQVSGNLKANDTSDDSESGKLINTSKELRLQGHAKRISDLLDKSFKDATEYFTSPRMIKFAGQILSKKVNGRETLLARYLKDGKGQRTFYLEKVVAANKSREFEEAFLEAVPFSSNYIRFWAENGCLSLIKLMLSKCADESKLDELLNRKSKEGDTALILASRQGHKDIVQYLLSKNAEYDSTNSYNENAAMAAAYKGHLDVLKVYEDNLPEEDFREFINCKNYGNSNTLLHAVATHQYSIVVYLLKRKADYYTFFEEGKNLACLVVSTGDNKLLESFAQGMSNDDFYTFINGDGLYGAPPLIDAVASNKISSFKTLLSFGARYDVVDLNGYNIATVATINMRPDMFKGICDVLSNDQLIKLFNMTDERGMKPLHYLSNQLALGPFLSVIRSRDNYIDLVADAAYYAAEKGYTKDLERIVGLIPNSGEQRFIFVNQPLQGYQHSLLDVSRLNKQEESESYLSSIERSLQCNSDDSKLKMRL